MSLPSSSGVSVDLEVRDFRTGPQGDRCTSVRQARERKRLPSKRLLALDSRTGRVEPTEQRLTLGVDIVVHFRRDSRVRVAAGDALEPIVEPGAGAGADREQPLRADSVRRSASSSADRFRGVSRSVLLMTMMSASSSCLS